MVKLITEEGKKIKKPPDINKEVNNNLYRNLYKAKKLEDWDWTIGNTNSKILRRN